MLSFLVAVSVSFVSVALEPVELQYKFELEEAVQYELVQNIDQSQSMFGQTNQSNTKIIQGLNTKLVTTKDDGSIIIANTLETMSLSIEGPGFSIAFNSQDPDDQHLLDDPTISSAAALIGVQIQLNVTPDGSVIDVPNLESIQRIVDEMEDPSVAAGIKPMVARETIIATNEMNYKLLPADPVSVGDQWSRSFEIPFGTSSMTTEFTITLERVNDGIAYMNMEGFISMTPIKQDGVITRLEDNRVSGSLEFNIEDGLTERYVMINEMKFDARGQGDADPVLILDMVQEVMMTRVDN